MLRILAIGNSFSQDATRYLQPIAQAVEPHFTAGTSISEVAVWNATRKISALVLLITSIRRMEKAVVWFRFKQHFFARNGIL